MPEVIFADTSFLVAFYNRKDDRHVGARAFIQRYIADRTPVAFSITDYIFDETVTTIMKQGGKTLAIDVAQKIYQSPTIKIFPIDGETFNSAYDMFTQYRDQMWSFTDCASFCFLNSLSPRPKVAAFDGHFAAAGFTIITTIG
jgi:predicted nucleic acid-binding protein